jgi:hypothetical protein
MAVVGKKNVNLLNKLSQEMLSLKAQEATNAS